jgi:hypothetical protein
VNKVFDRDKKNATAHVRARVLARCSELPSRNPPSTDDEWRAAARQLDPNGEIMNIEAWLRIGREADGKPSAQALFLQWLRSKDQSLSTEERAQPLTSGPLIAGHYPFFGGFHLWKTALEDAAKHPCAAALLGTFLGSVGRVLYALKPGDPAVPLQHYFQILQAINVYLFQSASEHLGHAASAQEMHSFMKTIMHESPAADELLQFVQDLHFVFALVDTQTVSTCTRKP